MTVERTTQVVVETVTDATPQAKVTQVVVEVLSTNVADDPAPPGTSARKPIIIIAT